MALAAGTRLGPYEIVALLTEADKPMQINVVLNWFEELKRLVPGK